MKNILLKIALLGFILCASAYTQNLGVGYSPYYGQASRRQEKPRLQDPFIKSIAERFNRDEGELYSLQEKGYGRFELIRLLLIALKAEKPFVQIIETRDKNIKISTIAKKYNLDYAAVYKEACEIKSELEKETTAQYNISVSSEGLKE